VEVGNSLLRRGHSFVLFTPAGKSPDWLEFRGQVRPFESLPAENFEVGICSEYSILPQFERLEAIFQGVLGGTTPRI